MTRVSKAVVAGNLTQGQVETAVATAGLVSIVQLQTEFNKIGEVFSELKKLAKGEL